MCFVRMLYCDCDLTHANSYNNVAPVLNVSISIPLAGQFAVVAETERENENTQICIYCAVFVVYSRLRIQIQASISAIVLIQVDFADGYIWLTISESPTERLTIST